MTTKSQSNSRPICLWMDRVWWLLFCLGLGFCVGIFISSQYCAYLGTDFRGYYASAQITWEHGFASVYDPRLQAEAQQELNHHCPDSSSRAPLLTVSMPYLPVFVLLFLPLPLIDFTSSYYIWSAVSLVVLFLYLLRFARSLGQHPKITPLLQWMICLPVLANLTLGQVNVFLVICLGEFVRRHIRGQDRISGLWVAAMLIKPHLLIILLPGLLAARKWKILTGFSAGALGVAVISLLLAGWQGVTASINLAAQFAGSLIQTGPTMTNWRALALNLGLFLPTWATWALAGSGALVTAAAVLSLWYKFSQPNSKQILLLVSAACTAAITISWHAHFYLLMVLIANLYVLDLQDEVPKPLKVIWIAGPPLVFLGAYVLLPDLARNLIGLTYLFISLGLLVWSGRKLYAEMRKNWDQQDCISD